MPRRRDRHQRGLRGPMAQHNSFSRLPAPVRRRRTAAEFFITCLDEGVATIARNCPQALEGMNIGVEDVPLLRAGWAGDQVPLAAALERTPDRPGHVVLYRRPLERRAISRKDLAALVYRMLVEQLAAATGLTTQTIDPRGEARDED